MKHLKSILDVIATIAIISTCGLIGWSVLNRRSDDRQPPTKSKVIADDAIRLSTAKLKGQASAPVALLVYSDFLCPYCATLATSVLSKLDESYVKDGRLRIGFKHFPLERLHPTARLVAQGTECAGRQGMFWKMHDLAFSHPKELDRVTIESDAATLGMDGASFSACLREEDQQVANDISEARSLGFTGTPTIVLGLATAGDYLRSPQALVGLSSLPEIEAAIKRLLAESSK